MNIGGATYEAEDLGLTLPEIEPNGQSKTEAAERCTVLRERAKYCLAISFVGANENIQVFCRPRFGVNAESIASHDKVLNVVVVEGAML